jgi:hypothetical protein
LRNYEAGSPKVDLKVGQCPAFVYEFGPCGLTQNLTQKEIPAMRILALDLSKYKTVACDYQAETADHKFATVATTAKGLHDLIVDRESARSGGDDL